MHCMRHNLLIFFGVLVFFPACVLAGESDVIINEIAAYESSDYEWIELFNRGTEKVDLTGWKFFEEGANHKLTVFRGDFTIDPGEYFIVANDAAKLAAKYPAYTGTIFDSSWSSLSEKGEVIGLKSSKSVKIEQFTFLAAASGSLERKDALLADYTSSNWKEYAKNNTIGAKNNASSSGQLSQDLPPQQTSSSSSTVATTPEPVWVPGKADVLINELVSDPEEGEREWIELYNPTRREIEISGWTLENGSRNTVMLSGKLGSEDLKRFSIIDLPAGFLRNSGDCIELRDARRFLIDSTVYGDWDDGDLLNNAPRATDPDALARTGDGANTYNNKNDFQVTTTPTKADSNRITKVSGGHPSEKYSGVIISEILPNPSSQKPGDEFIELYNKGNEPVNLDGWTMGASDGRAFVFKAKDATSLVLASKTYFVAARSMTNLVLRNVGGDRVRLYPPDSTASTSTVIYRDDAPLGMSYAVKSGSIFEWTRTPTPGEENSIVTENQEPDVVLDGEIVGVVGEFMTFDASDSNDPDNDPLDYAWDFGDFVTATGAVVNHTYIAPGTYVLLLSVGDGKKRTVLTKHVTILAVIPSSHGARFEGQESAPDMIVKKHNAPPTKSGNKKIIRMSKTGKTRAKIVGTGLSNIRSLPSGSRVSVRGVVSVEPGVLSESYFYIAGSGIQIWSLDKKFPTLRRGDHVVISGTLKKNGEDLAIRITDPSSIRVDSSGEEPTPHDISVNDVGEQNEGWLVRVSGVVQKVQWPNMYVGDGTQSVRIYVSRTTGIPHLAIEKGETITVQGIVSETKTGFRILPRDGNDISLPKKEQNASNSQEKQSGDIVEKQSTAHNSVLQYVFTGLAALLVVAGGLFLEYFRKREKNDGVVDREKMD